MVDFGQDNEKRCEQEDKRPRMPKEIEDLLRRVDELPKVDSRPEEEILGYGEDGIPR
jgi:hypothetical protein